MLIKNIINELKKEENGKRIGLFRIICSIFGGLIVSYLLMGLISLLIPSNPSQTVSFALLFYTFTWACFALWISLSPSKLSAILRVLIPSSVFSIFIYILLKT